MAINCARHINNDLSSCISYSITNAPAKFLAQTRAYAQSDPDCPSLYGNLGLDDGACRAV